MSAFPAADPVLDYAPPPAARDQWAAVLTGFLGWTLDAFDFFVFTFNVHAIATTFNVSDPKVQLVTGLTLAMRPVGALLFGLLADRYGRRRPLMVNLVFFSALSVLSGLAPTFGTFVACRMLFGIGMGGEWGVGASLAMEKVPAKWRGVMSGLLQEGYMVGLLLASGAVYFLLPHFGRFGWRPLFWIGGLPAILALYVRLQVRESEVWQRRAGEQNWSNLGGAVVRHWRVFLLITGLMFLMNLASHGTQDGYLSLFLQTERGYTPKQASAIVAVGAVGAICGGVLFGLLSDRIGRRYAIVAAFAGAIVAAPFYALLSPTTVLLAVGGFALQFMVQGAWGVIPAYITELSPDSVRGFLPGFGYQCGVCLAGSIGYVQAALKEHHVSYAAGMFWTSVAVSAASIAAFLAAGERRAVVFGTDPSETNSRGFEVVRNDRPTA